MMTVWGTPGREFVVASGRRYVIAPCEGLQFIPAHACPKFTVMCDDCEPPDFCVHTETWDEALEEIIDHEQEPHGEPPGASDLIRAWRLGGRYADPQDGSQPARVSEASGADTPGQEATNE